MQSSLIMALRTMVMLVALAAIPLAAIAGTGSWARVQELLDQARHKAIEYLYCSARATSGPSQPAPLAVPEHVAPLEEVSPIAVVSPIVEAPPPIAVPVEVVRPGRPPAPPFWPGNEQQPPASRPVADAMPAAHLDPLPRTPRQPEPEALDPMERMKQRLQTLGAIFFRLETTGPSGDTFRFHCKMVSPANPNYVRYFEATSGDPLRAVQHVLDQVELWSAGR